ncbi:hypothetical protein AB0M28_37470 [Streptomyces sp. NPDC051940]|uniref:hypothetical protein n=1 Tax=Streptomyces sp. NPDC051940 TaxID=3155675 RepID=UPI00341D1575
MGPLLAMVYATVAVQSLVTGLAGEVVGTFVAAAVLSAATTVYARGPGRPPRLVLILPVTSIAVGLLVGAVLVSPRNGPADG